MRKFSRTATGDKTHAILPAIEIRCLRLAFATRLRTLNAADLPGTATADDERIRWRNGPFTLLRIPAEPGGNQQQAVVMLVGIQQAGGILTINGVDQLDGRTSRFRIL